MIILVGTEKGGTGKTTLATNISVALARSGRDTLLLDADRQGTAANWEAERRERSDAGSRPRIHCVQRYGDLFQPLLDLAQRYQDIVIDAGGRDSIELRSSMLAADVLLCPLKASQFDLWSTDHVSELVRHAQALNRKLLPHAVLNMAPTHNRASEPDAARSAIADMAPLKLANTVVHDRKAFRDASCLGLSALEHNDPKAAEEISSLVNELIDGNDIRSEAEAHL